MIRLTLDVLTADAFAPYGEVFAPARATDRLDGVARLENGRAAARPNLFLACAMPVSLPHRIDRLEKHPFSSQTFLPFAAAPMPVVVALADAAGGPDLRTLRAFLAREQGFSYHAGIWHTGVASLGSAVPVAGFMYEDGTSDDCVFAGVPSFTLVEG